MKIDFFKIIEMLSICCWLIAAVIRQLIHRINMGAIMPNTLTSCEGELHNDVYFHDYLLRPDASLP